MFVEYFANTCSSTPPSLEGGLQNLPWVIWLATLVVYEDLQFNLTITVMTNVVMTNLLMTNINMEMAMITTMMMATIMMTTMIMVTVRSDDKQKI